MPVYIPEEILDKIIGCDTADVPGDPGRHFLCSASFVSRTFRQIALPYKFRSLTFQDRILKFDFNTVFPIPIPKFCEAINTRDAHALSLAPLVQELSLLYWTRESFEKIIDSVLSFQGLTKLTMSNCTISSVVMERLGELVQLQSLHTSLSQIKEYGNRVSYGALSNLRSLHTLACKGDSKYCSRYLACIPMKTLRILNSSDVEVIEALLTTDPPVQLKELWLTRYCGGFKGDNSLVWNYLARVTSLTHLSLPGLQLSDGLPSLIFPFRELQYLHIHVAFAPRFADQPLKKMIIDTESKRGQAMAEVRQHWQGTVFPHVEYLMMTDRSSYEVNEIPLEFWREFLLNVNKVFWNQSPFFLLHGRDWFTNLNLFCKFEERSRILSVL
jgi:hypothetical protein